MTRLRALGALERYMTTRSEMGIYNNIAVTASFERQQINELRSALYEALAIVVAKHPILSAVPLQTNTESPYFARLPYIDLDQAVQFVDIDIYADQEVQGRSSILDGVLKEQHSRPFTNLVPLLPYWRLLVFIDPKDAMRFTLSFVFHHCIADTKSAIIFFEDIEGALAVAESSDNPCAKLKSPNIPLAPPMDDFLSHVSTTVPKTSTDDNSQKKWTGAPQFIPAETEFRSYWLSAETTQNLLRMAKKRRASLTSTLQTILAAALFENLPDWCTRINIDCPVSLRPWLPAPIQSTMGCFIDNFGAIHQRGTFHWEKVQRMQAGIDDVLQNRGGDNMCDSIARMPGLRIWFEEKMGQARPSAFELSNVGKLAPRKAKGQCEIKSLLFSQSAGACSGAVKVSVATGRDDRLTLGFTWQTGAVEDELVENLVSSFHSTLDTVLQSEQVADHELK